jgi:pimeloyl-ACP methyl ester carboxylesterase/predicted Ser/Thr protein kinase
MADEQQIHFCVAKDGVRLAWASLGSGPALVKAANWLNHLEFDWHSPIWHSTLSELARGRLLVRYDERGNGLSDWDVADLSFESFVRDLEAVADAARLDRFALLGISQGGAVATAYAVRHPERVSKLVLLGAYARGWARRQSESHAEQRRALLTLVRHGWGRDNEAFRQVWARLYAPEATPEHVAWFSDMQRVSTSPENAVRLMTAFSEIDVTDLMPAVQTPTLVLHAVGDEVVPQGEGQLIASLIPGARFATLDSRNHVLLPGEPAWHRFLDEVRAFLDDAGPRSVTAPGNVRSRLPAGSEFGHYRIVGLLGKGGMGQVFRATDTRLGRDVAIKVLDEPGETDEDARERVLREARHAAMLSHPNVCAVFDVADAPGRRFIVMELVDGRPLNELRRDGGLPASEVARYGAQIADALRHAHERGVVHRDLKTANIMLDATGRVRVLDFGIASRLPAGGDGTPTEATLAVPGVMLGTLQYLAPEVLRGKPADTRSDIWGLGVVLHELATGQLPFSGDTAFELTSAILERPPCALSSVRPRLRRVIATCLQKDPSGRYQRAAAARDLLEAIARAPARRSRAR